MNGSALSATARTFLDRYVRDASKDADAPGGPGASAHGGLGGLTAARAGFAASRRQALGQITRLRGTMQRAYRSKPELSEEVAQGLGRLDGLVARIDPGLEKDLEAVLAAEPHARPALAAKARRSAMALAQLLDTDPIARALDGNDFAPNMTVISDLNAALDAALAALDAV